MKTYYKVGLYNIKKELNSYKAEFIDTILAEKDLLCAYELSTGKAFPIFTGGFCRIPEQAGYHLVVKKEDFSDDNMASYEDISEYIDKGTESKFYEVIYNMLNKNKNYVK